MIYPHYSVDLDFGSGWTQALMLTDEVRLNAYREALVKYAKEKSILELGMGTGILCQYAESAGASKITGIESNDAAFRFGILRNDLFGNSNVSLIHSDASQTTVNEHDLIVFELFGGRLFDESVVEILRKFKDLNAWATKKDILFLPCSAKLFAKAVFVPELKKKGTLPTKTVKSTKSKITPKLYWATSPDDFISSSNWVNLLTYSFGGPAKDYPSPVSTSIDLYEPANALLWGFTLNFDDQISLDVRLGKSQTTSWGGSLELFNSQNPYPVGQYTLSVTIPKVFNGCGSTFSPILKAAR